MKKQTLSPIYLLILVFLAGFSFLVYEVSWFRMLSLALGATVKASTVVLVAFMAGFGVGAWYWGKFTTSRFNPNQLLKGLLITTALLGLISFFAIENALPELYRVFGKTGMSHTLIELIVFILALLLLFSHALFMGGVLPVVSGMLATNNAGLSGILGRIYAWETLGSTIGGLAAGFIFIRLLGQEGTVLLAAFINLLSVFLLLVFKYQPAIIPSFSSEKVTQNMVSNSVSKEKEDVEAIKKKRYSIILATTVFGFVVLGLQVAWFRIFRIYMTNTSYTFSLIASVVILGLYAGSSYFSVKGKQWVNSFSLLKLLLFTALAVVFGFFILIKFPQLIMFPLAGNQDAYLMRIIIIPIISALIVILPVTFLSGIAFPLACSLFTPEISKTSKSVGQILLYNTAGSVAGPLVSAFILIPVLGVGLTLLFYTMILLIAAYLLAIKISVKTIKLYRNISIGLAVIVLIVLLIIPKIQILPPSFSRFEKGILKYRETVEGTLVVGREPGGNSAALSTFVNNSAVIGSSYDAIKVVKMVGHLPFYAGLKCKNVLVVGFGIGVTTSAIASHNEVERIDCIELVAGLKDAAHYYSGLNNNIQNDPRLNIISGDGRHYLQLTGSKYDLISSDPTHPILGSGSLYTKEYFQLCKSKLNPGGMVSQYLPLHKLLPDDFKSIIKTFHNVFPDATVWLGQNHAVLLGANGPFHIGFVQWSSNISSSVKDPYFYNNPYSLAACLVLDSTAIAQFSKETRLNTDNRPITEFFKLSSFESQNLTQNLAFLNLNRGGIERLFDQIPDPVMMDRFVEGNRIFTNGLGYELSGNRMGFLKKLREAAVMNPENEEYTFLIRFYSGR